METKMSDESLHDLHEYQVLDPPGNAIRVITLLPGENEDVIFMEIRHVELSDPSAAKYEALSYTWGFPTQPREKIYIWQTKQDGTDIRFLTYLPVRANLFSALKYLRLPNASQVLWIDAICIDQSNIAERGQEVGRMGDIYHKAERVLVWLGPDDSDTPMALETIKTLSAGITIPLRRRNINVTPGSEAAIFRTQPEESTLTAAHWAALNKFITRPWFQRLWIRQEVRMASQVLVKCGHFEAEWENIEKTILFVEHTPGAKAHFSIHDVLFCRSLFPYHGSDSLAYVLHRSSKCGHFDDRDLVYANLSTSTAIKALQIKPDYQLAVAAVYKDLVCQYLQHFGTLDILRGCDLRSKPQGFQSFVPDFSISKSESRLVSIFAHAGTKQLPIDTSGESLSLKGKSIAKVSQVSTIVKPLASNDLVDSIKNLIKIFHQWEPKDLTTTMYPTGGSLLDAYVLLLAAGFCKDTYRYDSLATREDSTRAFLAAVWSGGNLERSSDPEFRPYLDELTSDRRGEIFFQTAEGYVGTAPVGVDVERGDIISILAGGSVPFVLRPVPDVSDCYELVGPCFLQGAMFGEAILGPLPEPWSCILDDNRRWCFKNGSTGKLTWEDPRLWPLSAPWQVHFCNYDDDGNPCGGACVEKLGEDSEQGSNLMERFWFNEERKQKSRDDPRLDLAGLEKGGITLETFTLV